MKADQHDRGREDTVVRERACFKKWWRSGCLEGSMDTSNSGRKISEERLLIDLDDTGENDRRKKKE